MSTAPSLPRSASAVDALPDADLVTPPGSGEGAARSSSAAWRRLGDVLAVALLATVLVWLAGHDGGYERDALVAVTLVALTTVPWAVAEARRLPVAGQVLLGLWGGGAIVSLLFAEVRAGFTIPAMTIGVVALTGFAGRRVWRRSWGPGVVVAVLLVAFGAYWQRSFLQWWGQALSGTEQRWLALSWRNQSGILMAAFAMPFAGLAFRSRRLHTAAAGLFAAMALAGTWLSSSRAAPLFAVVGIAVVAAAAARRGRKARVAGVAAAVLVTAALVVGGLTNLAVSSGGTSAAPVSQRDQAASGNLLARVHHAGAALGMFADDPWTGQGLGSYRHVASGWTSSRANLTAYAHNHYASMLGGGGIVTGGAFLGLGVAALVLVTREVRRRSGGQAGTSSDGASVPGVGAPGSRGISSSWRDGLALGAVGMVLVVAGHSAMDFDWRYPVLPCLLAIGVGILSARVGTPDASRVRRAGWWAALGAVVPITLVALAGVAGGLVESRPVAHDDPAARAAAAAPWDAGAAERAALELSAASNHADALEVLDRARRWNPGLPRLRTVQAVVAYRAGDAGPEEVVATLEVGSVPFATFNFAAEALLDGGDNRAAAHVLHRVLRAYPDYRAWGIDEAREDSRRLLERAQGSWHYRQAGRAPEPAGDTAA